MVTGQLVDCQLAD